MLMGHEVTVVDNFFTGRKRNIEQWVGHENFELITHDIVTPLHLEGQLSSMIFIYYKNRTRSVAPRGLKEVAIICGPQ